MKKKSEEKIPFNLETSLKTILLLGFAFFYMYTIVTGSVKQYVHPRMIPFMIIATILMSLMAFALIGNTIKGNSLKKMPLSLLFYLVPLIMAFAIPAISFDSKAPVTADLNLSSGQSSDLYDNKSLDPILQDEPTDTEMTVESVSKDQPLQALIKNNSSIQSEDGVIRFNDSNYYSYLVELYDNMEEYEGQLIELIGFVYIENQVFSENQFVITRLMMVCCAADMAPMGLLCLYENTSSLPLDSWVKVTGIVQKTSFQENSVPAIVVTTIETINPPAVQYIYPY